MGIIALALVAGGHLAPGADPPFWVIVSAALAMGAGTYAGGWRIIKTLGTRIAKLDPPQGFAAQTACASILWTTAHLRLPGLDDARDLRQRHGRRRLAQALGGALGRRREHRGRVDHDDPVRRRRRGAMELMTRLPAGDAIVFVLAAAIAWTAFAARRWQTRRLATAPA